MLDPAVLESYSHEIIQMTKDPKPIYYKSEVLQNPYIVQPTDLMYPNSGLQNEDSSQSVHQLNLIWLASHIALIEMILRTYLLNTITPVTLINALSIITGCHLKENSIKGLQGADGALFWLVTVAARTVTILGINDCTEWLTDHLTGDENSKKEQSESSCDSTYTINTDSLKESADKFLRGLAMANLVALTFHFYCPELAPAKDFLFNFPPTGEMEPAASHHNARAIALICQNNIDLYNVLFLMPDSCNGNIIRLNDSGSTTLNTLNLLGFCSQGLARSPTHRRLQHAAMAGELFVWFTSSLRNREINPIIPSTINYTKYIQQFKDSKNEGFNSLKCKTSDTDDNQINMIQLDQVNDDSNSASGRGTYRLDETFNRHQSHGEQSTKQNLQTSYFIRSKTIRLNKNLSDFEKLNSKLKELSTKQLVNSKTGGIYLPIDSSDTPRNEENKQSDVENQDESQNTLTKWNPLEGLFRPNVVNESTEVFINIPSTENHVAETECADHRGSEVMSYYPVVDYQYPNTTQGNILNCKILNVDSAHVTTKTKSQCLKESPVTEEEQAPYSSQTIHSKSFRHNRSLSHNRMLPTYSSSQHKSQTYDYFNPSRRSGYQISYSRKHPTDHHDKNSRFFKWRHRPSRRRNNLTHNNIEGYSDSDLNTVYYNRNNIEYSSTDCSSSSEQSTEALGEGIYLNYSSQKRHGHCPTFANNAQSRRTSTQNGTRKLYNRERSKRRQRNIPETINQPYFYGSHPVQQQVHCVYPYETANQKVYTDIHCLPYAPVQPTWIRPPFITNTLNPCPFYATNQPTFVGSPSVSVIPRLHSTSPLSFSHPHNADQLLVYNLNEQNVLVPESNNPNVHIITEAIVSTESANLQTQNCSPISNVTIQNQSESTRSYLVPQHEIISNQNFEPNAATSSSIQAIQAPICYSQAESFFIPFETDSSNVSSTFHNKHSSKFKSKNKSVTNQQSIHNFTELKHSNTFDNDVVNLDGMSLKSTNAVVSTAQLENYHLSGSNRITSSSDAIEQSVNNIHTTPGQYVDNCKSKQSEKQIQEHIRPKKDSILPTYLEKRSMKAYKKEINNSENSRPSSGKLQITSNMKETSFKTDENVVNTSKVVIPIHQRRTASVSRTIGIVKPNFNGGQRRHTQDELSLLDVKSQSHTNETGSSGDLKLFVQLQTKSNRRAISNALNYCCLAGPVNETMKRTALEALGCSDGKHFIILLKSQCQYSGLYNYLPIIEKAVRISGTGPSKIENNMVDKYYKYDSGLKRFVEINSTSHMSTIIDAIQLHGRSRNYSTKSYAAQTTNSTKCPLHAK
ncbi:hypothetical protein Smp_194430 [Schistosoma mansoni]|uniref:hypothetical protein n=1 Tax=Schistosoma mansoni TaxID=6183 RepID=UPI00022C83E1|nr:hypothetical protein Smp_194430 [Schistosoma mansoni]|eukprot:XP_018644953.1 hypothetical protein Smp_194430 [Schistosoma mansoni]